MPRLREREDQSARFGWRCYSSECNGMTCNPPLSDFCTNSNCRLERTRSGLTTPSKAWSMGKRRRDPELTVDEPLPSVLEGMPPLDEAGSADEVERECSGATWQAVSSPAADKDEEENMPILTQACVNDAAEELAASNRERDGRDRELKEHIARVKADLAKAGADDAQSTLDNCASLLDALAACPGVLTPACEALQQADHAVRLTEQRLQLVDAAFSAQKQRSLAEEALSGKVAGYSKMQDGALAFSDGFKEQIEAACNAELAKARETVEKHRRDEHEAKCKVKDFDADVAAALQRA